MFIRLLASLTAIIITCSPALALQSGSSSVNGFVEDSVTKETLVGATAKVKGTKFGAYTNKSGYFSIGSIPPGTYTLTVSAVGYTTRELPLTIAAGKPQKLRVQLVPSVAKGDAVVVTADREEDKRQISISRVNISMGQISQLSILPDLIWTFYSRGLTGSEPGTARWYDGVQPDTLVRIYLCI